MGTLSILFLSYALLAGLVITSRIYSKGKKVMTVILSVVFVTLEFALVEQEGGVVAGIVVANIVVILIFLGMIDWYDPRIWGPSIGGIPGATKKRLLLLSPDDRKKLREEMLEFFKNNENTNDISKDSEVAEWEYERNKEILRYLNQIC
jgi:hypothetical protein